MECRMEGAETLINNLKDIEEKVATKWIRKAMQAGAYIIKNYVLGNVPFASGTTARSIIIKNKYSKKRPQVLVTLSHKLFPSNKPFYVGFLNAGHMSGKRWSKDRHPIPGTEWLQKSFEESLEPMQSEMLAVLREGFNVEANKRGIIDHLEELTE